MFHKTKEAHQLRIFLSHMQRAFSLATILLFLIILSVFVSYEVKPSYAPEKGKFDDSFLATLTSSSSEWERTYGMWELPGGLPFGEYEWSRANSAIQTNDGGYVLAGLFKFRRHLHLWPWLLKTDSVGNVQWSRTYSGKYDNGDLKSVIQASDGGYVVGGETWEKLPSDSELWLFKTDAEGNLQWSKTYGVSGYAGAVVQTHDGYALIGYQPTWTTWLVKTDLFGDLQWIKRYGDEGEVWSFTMVHATDGGLTLAGKNWTRSNNDFLLIRIDALGNQLWSRTYSGVIDSSISWVSNPFIIQTDDSGYLLAGDTDNGLCLFKTDSLGNVQWSRTHGGIKVTTRSVVQDDGDGGYAVAGSHTLVKTDRNGNLRWNRTFAGGFVYSIVQTYDLGFALAGKKPEGAGSISWLIKVEGDNAPRTSDFQISANPQDQAISPGNSTSFTIHLTTFEQAARVSLSLSGLPKEAYCAFSSSSIIPNATVALTIQTSAQVKAQTYNLTLVGTTMTLTRFAKIRLIVVLLDDQPQQQSETVTFSLSESLQGSKSFTVAGTSVTISATIDVSLTMPIEVISTSNATTGQRNSIAQINTKMLGGVATLTVTYTVSATVASTVQSVAIDLPKSFVGSPGSSEITLDTFSIPAISEVIGEVTIDLTPRIILKTQIHGNLDVSGPATTTRKSLQWISQGSIQAAFISFDEEKEVEVSIDPIFELTSLTFIMHIDATLSAPIIGSTSYPLGTLELSQGTSISTEGNPKTLTIAKFSPSTSPTHPIEINLYLIAAGGMSVVIILAIAISLKRRKSKRLVETPKETLR